MERYRGLLCQWSLRQDVAAMKKCASTTKKANSNLDRKRSMLLHPRGKNGSYRQLDAERPKWRNSWWLQQPAGCKSCDKQQPMSRCGIKKSLLRAPELTWAPTTLRASCTSVQQLNEADCILRAQHHSSKMCSCMNSDNF